MQQCFFCKVFSQSLVVQELASAGSSAVATTVWRCADTQACEQRVRAAGELRPGAPRPSHICSRCHHTVRDEELCYDQHWEAEGAGETGFGRIEYRCVDEPACTERLRSYLWEEIERAEVDIHLMEDRLQLLRTRLANTQRELAGLE